jgi:transcription elongation factor Elf1
LNDMASGEKLIRTTCNHVYHATCLISALRSSNTLTCPLCRASFDPLTSD